MPRPRQRGVEAFLGRIGERVLDFLGVVEGVLRGSVHHLFGGIFIALDDQSAHTHTHCAVTSVRAVSWLVRAPRCSDSLVMGKSRWARQVAGCLRIL